MAHSPSWRETSDPGPIESRCNFPHKTVPLGFLAGELLFFRIVAFSVLILAVILFQE